MKEVRLKKILAAMAQIAFSAAIAFLLSTFIVGLWITEENQFTVLIAQFVFGLTIGTVAYVCDRTAGE